jgi:aryl-alcohol dehydrogenase-like predicted oxidoreductase
MIPLCRDLGVGVIPWSPLARGLLTRRPDAEATLRARTDGFARSLYVESDRVVVEAVHEVGVARGLPPAQIALAWLLHRPGVVAPIVGATKVGHIEDAIAAVEVSLSEEEIRRLEEPYRPHPIRGHS